MSWSQSSPCSSLNLSVQHSKIWKPKFERTCAIRRQIRRISSWLKFKSSPNAAHSACYTCIKRLHNADNFSVLAGYTSGWFWTRHQKACDGGTPWLYWCSTVSHVTPDKVFVSLGESRRTRSFLRRCPQWADSWSVAVELWRTQMHTGKSSRRNSVTGRVMASFIIANWSASLIIWQSACALTEATPRAHSVKKCRYVSIKPLLLNSPLLTKSSRSWLTMPFPNCYATSFRFCSSMWTLSISQSTLMLGIFVGPLTFGNSATLVKNVALDFDAASDSTLWTNGSSSVELVAALAAGLTACPFKSHHLSVPKATCFDANLLLRGVGHNLEA